MLADRVRMYLSKGNKELVLFDNGVGGNNFDVWGGGSSFGVVENYLRNTFSMAFEANAGGIRSNINIDFSKYTKLFVDVKVQTYFGDITESSIGNTSSGGLTLITPNDHGQRISREIDITTLTGIGKLYIRHYGYPHMTGNGSVELHFYKIMLL